MLLRPALRFIIYLKHLERPPQGANGLTVPQCCRRLHGKRSSPMDHQHEAHGDHRRRYARRILRSRRCRLHSGCTESGRPHSTHPERRAARPTSRSSTCGMWCAVMAATLAGCAISIRAWMPSSTAACRAFRLSMLSGHYPATSSSINCSSAAFTIPTSTPFCARAMSIRS